MRAERFRVVSVLDEALDVPGKELEQYASKRDFALVENKYVPGQKPVIFHVREVPNELWEAFVEGGTNEADRYKRAFMAGLEKVENLPDLATGESKTWAPSNKVKSLSVTLLHDDDLQLFAPSERIEIGSVIYRHSFLPRRTEAEYPLPSSLVDPLVRRVRRDAERTPGAASATTSDDSPPE